MTLCPYCNRSGIAELAKRRSSREYPAQCTLCGRLSHAIASSSSGIAGFTIVIALLMIVAGIALGQWIVGALCGVGLGAAYNRWAWRRVELCPISAESAARSRKASWIVNVLAILGIIGQ